MMTVDLTETEKKLECVLCKQFIPDQFFFKCGFCECVFHAKCKNLFGELLFFASKLEEWYCTEECYKSAKLLSNKPKNVDFLLPNAGKKTPLNVTDAKLEDLTVRLNLVENKLDASLKPKYHHEIVIINCPQASSNNARTLVCNLLKYLDCDFPHDEIIEIKRLSLKDNQNKGRKIVIVELKSAVTMRYILARCRAKGKIFVSTRYGVNGLYGAAVFVAEGLSRYKRNLLTECRKFIRRNDFRYCWVRNGVIHLRKYGGANTYCIKRFADLYRLN